MSMSFGGNIYSTELGKIICAAGLHTQLLATFTQAQELLTQAA